MFTFLEDGGSSVKLEDVHQLWNSHVLFVHSLPVCCIFKENPTDRARTIGLMEFFYFFKKEDDLSNSNMNILSLQLGQLFLSLSAEEPTNSYGQ